MKLLDLLFGRQQPEPVDSHPWIPRTLPGKSPSPRRNAREYIRKIHSAAAYQKKFYRDTYEGVLSRAEARLAHMTYQAYLEGESEHLLAARVSSVKKGWPFFPLALWQTGARYLLRSFSAKA